MDDSSKHALNLGQMVFRAWRPMAFRRSLVRERFRVKPGMTIGGKPNVIKLYQLVIEDRPKCVGIQDVVESADGHYLLGCEVQDLFVNELTKEIQA